MSSSKKIKLEDSSKDSLHTKLFIDELEKFDQAKNLAEVKSFVIFGNSLYPNNFQVKFAGYKCIKKNEDYKMAASLLNEMYTKFPSDLYGELVKILDDVKVTGASANKEIFYCLNAQVQYDILKKFCQILDTPYEQIVLLLEIIKAMTANIQKSGTGKYHQLLASEIKHLLDLLCEAEDDWRIHLKTIGKNTDTLINFYRHLLAVEIVPIIHKAPKGVIDLIDKRKINDVVMRSLQFYLAYATFIPDCPSEMEADSDGYVQLKINASESTLNNADLILTDIWPKLKSLLSMAADLLKWYGSQTMCRYPQTAIIYENLSTASYCVQVKSLIDYAASSSGNKQLFLVSQIGCVVWVGLAELIMSYLRLSKPYLWFAGQPDRKHPDSVFLFCKGEATGKLVNYQKNSKRMRQIHQAFSIATNLYAAVPIKDWDKISEKVEPQIRSQSWAFDSMFFLDLALLRGPLMKSKTYLRDPRLKSIYPKNYRELMNASISQCVRDKNKKTLKALLEVLASCSSPLNSGFQDCFDELSEMTVGYTYLIEFSANNILMLIVHLLFGWLSSVASARTPMAPIAASYILVLLQVKKTNFKSQVGQNSFILIEEGGSSVPLHFLDFITSVEIIEEIISQIEIFEKTVATNVSSSAKEDKNMFINNLKKACVDRVESDGFSKPKSVEVNLMDFLKTCKTMITACIS